MYSKTEVLSLSLFLIVDKMHQIEKVYQFFNQLFGGEVITNKTIDLLRNQLVKDAIFGKKIHI